MRKIWFVLAAICLALALLPGCSEKEKERFQDAPTADERNSDEAVVIEFPDGFSNVAGKCDGPNYLYSGYKVDANLSAIAVVTDDPRCTDAPPG